MRNKPLISIIIPCYNQASYLPEAIESVLAQTYSNWECIIVDDGSIDNSESVALDFCQKDSRIQYFKKANGGVASARNFGIQSSKGHYILPLDGDDKIGKDYLLLAINAFQKNASLKVVYCKAELFGEQSGEWKLPAYKFKELFLFNTIFCSGVFRRSDYDKYGGYDEALTYGGEDWEFWINFLKDGGEVLQLDSIQFYYRKLKKSRSTTVENDYQKDVFCRNMIFQKHFDMYQNIFADPITIYHKAYALDKEMEVISRSRINKLIKMIWDIKKKLGF